MAATTKLKHVDHEKYRAQMAAHLGQLEEEALEMGDLDKMLKLKKLARKVGSCGPVDRAAHVYPCKQQHFCYRCSWYHGAAFGRTTFSRFDALWQAVPDLSAYLYTLSLQPCSDEKLVDNLHRFLSHLPPFLASTTNGASWALDVSYEKDRWFVHAHGIALVIDAPLFWPHATIGKWFVETRGHPLRQYVRGLAHPRQGDLDQETKEQTAAWRYLTYPSHGPRNLYKYPLSPKQLFFLHEALVETGKRKGLKSVPRVRGLKGMLHARTYTDLIG